MERVIAASSGSTGDLREQLERALPGAEIRDVETDIGIQNTDESHIREM